MTEFNVQGMHCGACASRITHAVKAIDPAAEVTTDLAKQTVQIESNVDPAKLAGVLQAAGYPPH
jgi:copper chaperone